MEVEGIRGGWTVPDYAFKYQVSILINGHHACGGSILDFKRILSVAQCVVDQQGNFLDVKFEILAGVSRLASQSYFKVRKTVWYIYIVYDFRPLTRVNQLYPDNLETGDIAVLEVEGTLPLGENNQLKTVYMPLLFHGNYQKYVTKSANLSGFGQDQPMEYRSASNLNNLLHRQNTDGVLKFTKTTVLRGDHCQKAYDKYQDYHLCAKSNYGLAGGCNGDIGGPLVIEGNFIIGVLQIYPDGCDDQAKPSLYTRITSYIDFIENVMRGDFKSDMRLANYTGQHVVEKRHPGHPV